MGNLIADSMLNHVRDLVQERNGYDREKSPSGAGGGLDPVPWVDIIIAGTVRYLHGGYHSGGHPENVAFWKRYHPVFYDRSRTPSDPGGGRSSVSNLVVSSL